MDSSSQIELPGHVENGVVVLDGGASLPEGAEVRVSCVGHETVHGSGVRGSVPALMSAEEPDRSKQRVEFPLVKTGVPGSLHLTNDQIHKILEQEDRDALKGQGNVPS